VRFHSIKSNYNAFERQIPGKSAEINFKDERKTFTEEQVKIETSRCLGCGASVVDPNKCLGCGVCTTRCKFDAIHLKKRTYNESVPYGKRPEEFAKFIAERQKKIEIRKISEKQ